MLVERLQEKGREVQVNAWALHDDRLELHKEKRTAILDEAMSHLRPAKEPGRPAPVGGPGMQGGDQRV